MRAHVDFLRQYVDSEFAIAIGFVYAGLQYAQ
jgi:hypothetical protein